MTFSTRTISIIVNVFKYFHLLFIILTGLLFIVVINFSTNATSISAYMLPLITSTLIFRGLSRRKFWVIPLMVGLGIFAIVRLSFYQPPELYLSIVRVAGFGLSAFQIFFFTKKEVREYFKRKA